MTMIQIQNVIFAYGDREIIRWEGTYQLDDGDRIGIVGRNGSGKTTLLKLLYGEMAPDSGIVRVRTDFALIRQQEDEDRRADTESYEAAAPSRMLQRRGHA